jgi:hypothetical protein
LKNQLGTIPDHQLMARIMARKITIPSRAGAPVSLLAVAVGAVAFGAFAIGALAIGRLAVGRVTIKRARFNVLEVDELTVRKLRVVHQDEPGA